MIITKKQIFSAFGQSLLSCATMEIYFPTKYTLLLFFVAGKCSTCLSYLTWRQDRFYMVQYSITMQYMGMSYAHHFLVFVT